MHELYSEHVGFSMVSKELDPLTEEQKKLEVNRLRVCIFGFFTFDRIKHLCSRIPILMVKSPFKCKHVPSVFIIL